MEAACPVGYQDDVHACHGVATWRHASLDSGRSGSWWPGSKGGGSRGATGALAPPIAKVGGLSPPKLKLTPLLRTLNFDIATWKWQAVGTFAVEFFRCICSLIL